jgi:hypothetical protein
MYKNPRYTQVKWTIYCYGDFCCLLWQLTCLVLPGEHLALLWPKSIWSAEKRPERCSAMENILQLEPLEVSYYILIWIIDLFLLKCVRMPWGYRLISWLYLRIVYCSKKKSYKYNNSLEHLWWSHMNRFHIFCLFSWFFFLKRLNSFYWYNK